MALSWDLSPDQRLVLEVIYEEFCRLGSWPVSHLVDLRLDREADLDLNRVLPTIPLEVVVYPRIAGTLSRPDITLSLTLEGLVCCVDSDRDVMLYLALLRWCADRERSWTPKTSEASEAVSVAAAAFTKDMRGPVSTLELHMLGELLHAEPGVWRTAGNVGTESWTFDLTREIRRFRGVANLDGYRAHSLVYERADKRADETEVAARSSPADEGWDFFICHASEDKDAIARPLYQELTRRGYRVWLDETALTLGDSLRSKIDEGILSCRFGIVIFSRAFFAKNWANHELDGLVTRQMQGPKVVLPVWHGVDRAFVASYSPSLADRLAIPTDHGISAIADAVEIAAGTRHHPSA